MEDFEALRAFHAPKLDELPHPAVSTQPWHNFIAAHPMAWKALIRQYIFYTSSALTARGVLIFEHQLHGAQVDRAATISAIEESTAT